MAGESETPDVEVSLDGTEEFERVLDFLARDDVLAFLRTAARHAATISSLKNTVLPAGLTLNQSALLVGAVRRLSAICSPDTLQGPLKSWHCLTAETCVALRRIDQHCTTGSELDRTVRGRDGRRFLVLCNCSEAIAAARLDGLEIDYTTARDLLLTSRSARQADERVLVNYFRVLDALEELVGTPWSPELLLEIHRRLSRGSSQADEPVSSETLDGLERLCEYADNRTISPFQHPVVTALGLLTRAQMMSPFPRWNGLMARIMYRLYCLKNDYPVLGYIPTSRAVLEWRGLELPVVADLANPDSVLVLERYDEQDVTPFISAHLEVIMFELDRLRDRIRIAEERDATVRGQLQEDASLNHRQRSIVGRALRVPDATFRISYHRTTHGIGYATAHRDLTELVERGYLVARQEDRAFIFRAAPDLADRLARPQHAR